MDIIARIDRTDYELFLENQTDYVTEISGGGFLLLTKKRFGKKYLSGKIYLLLDNKIVGYGKVFEQVLLGVEEQAVHGGKLWEYLNYYKIGWKKTYWFQIPVVCNIKLVKFKMKRINLQRVLNGHKEPELISQEELAKKEGVQGKAWI